MHSNFNLSIVSSGAETSMFSDLPAFCDFPVSYARQEFTPVQHGQVFKQTFQSYLAHFTLFEAQLKGKCRISFSLDRPGIFMILVFKGAPIFPDREKQSASDQSSSCYLSYIPAGCYPNVLSRGDYAVMMIEVRPDWFMTQNRQFTSFIKLSDAFHSEKKTRFNLPPCSIDKGLLQSIKRLQTYKGKDDSKLDISIHILLNKIIHYYHNKLQSKTLNVVSFRQQKANEIERFVKENFTEKIVDDVYKMADMFCMSEKNLQRLAKVAFGIPLHEQVIRYRMTYSKKLILTTSKAIHDIARMMGYRDALYFSRAFKKFHKIPPIEVRHRGIKGNSMDS